MQRDTSSLIRRIYDAVDDVDALPDVLSGMCERMGGENGMLGILMKTPGPVPFAVLSGLDPALMPTLNARHLNNVWRQHMVTLPVGIPAASDSFVSLDQVRRTDFYGEILEPWDIGHSALFALDDMPTFHVAMSINRSTRRGPFTSTELEASQELLPHLRRAMQLRLLLERSRRQEKLALETLDKLAAGVVILDSQARVLFANMAAQEIAAAGDVLVLTDGTVRPRQREQCDFFRRLIGSAIAGGAGGSLLLSSSSPRLPVSALVSPLAGALALSLAAQGRPGAAAVLLSDPEVQAAASTERLRALYKLSTTEARVAWLVMRSGSIGRAARALALSPETVRTHLKHIYAKTGVNRQSALALLLAAATVARVP
ncbi:helix-turn-helix transcriptional regulator [Mesorhizobium sophorae]|uniref:helix-turn-helix transcriptional regulator n=1 Tax=Mesorhizobium sophorae TaxID=1300294 RepID=UPI000BA348B0|nr:helix-turn-helix transcriptional regulator [Mesorhizobium sophorae]